MKFWKHAKKKHKTADPRIGIIEREYVTLHRNYDELHGRFVKLLGRVCKLEDEMKGKAGNNRMVNLEQIVQSTPEETPKSCPLARED